MQRYVRNDELMWSEVADDIVALDATRGHCFGMGDVSAVVWRLLEEPRTIADLCDELTKLYAVDEDTCRRDITDLIEKMVSEHVVRKVGD